MIDPDVSGALSEIGNVGIGKATTALGDLIGRKITIQPPQIFSAGTDISALAGLEPDTIVMGILMRLAKNLGGTVMILVNKDFMSDLVCKMTGVQYSDDELIENEDSLSAIQEVANIMAASYMNAIGTYTGLRIYLTPVMVGIDMVAAIVSYPLAQMSLESERIICIDTSFNLDEKQPGADGAVSQKLSGRMIMMPDDASVQVIMNALNL